MPCIHVCMHAGSQTLQFMARINTDIYAHVHINANKALVLYCLIILCNTAEDQAHYVWIRAGRLTNVEAYNDIRSLGKRYVLTDL